ncbi:unnamed protein product [Ectocarpus sp. 6 AP-2014]
MAGRGRGGRFGGWGGNSRGKSGASGRGGGDAAALARVLNTADCCACVSNTPLLVELKNLDEECLRTGKVKLRHGLMRAMKSLKRYPLPITTEKEACALEGVGSFTARRMLRGLLPVGPEPDNSSGVRRTDEENIEPSGSSSSRGGGGGARKSSNNSTGTSSVTNAGAGSCLASHTNCRSLLRMNLRVGSSATTTTGGRPRRWFPISPRFAVAADRQRLTLRRSDRPRARGGRRRVARPCARRRRPVFSSGSGRRGLSLTTASTSSCLCSLRFCRRGYAAKPDSYRSETCSG